MHLLAVSDNILLFISGFGIVQAFLIAGILYFHPRSERSLTIFLAIYIICLSTPMFLPLAQYFFPWQIYIFIAPFTLMVGPSLYLYVRSFKEVITFRKAWPHFIPSLIYFIIVWGLNITIGSRYPPAKEMPEEVLHNPMTIVPISIRMIQMLVYYFLSRKELASYQQSIQHLFSETSRINLSWVRLLVNGYLIIVVTTISLYSLVLLYTDYFSLFILINAAVCTPYIYLATFKGITQPTLWQIQSGSNRKRIELEIHEAEEIGKRNINNEPLRQPKTAINEKKITEIAEQVVIVLEKDKLYGEPELTLQVLADKLSVPTYLLSQAINEGIGKNFYDLVNGYRVEEAKRLLLDSKNKNYTILSVGFEAGFNSKTTFNTVFKKFTGLTPTEFRDKQKSRLSEV